MRPHLHPAVIAALLSVLSLTVAEAGERTYRWTDDKGRVHYSDVKSAQGEQVQVKPGGRIAPTPKISSDLVALRQQECQRRKDQVELYNSSAEINETDSLGNSRTFSMEERRQLIERAQQQAAAACSQPGLPDAPKS
ncbi:MAG: DUF4124 domain-containing protein [Pseudomonadota bacterium]